ncbi:hypothetical protein V6M85_14080 (plasmid) [Sulfolobus tengchongensis]|uniref:SWIM-type domain-containing protein n=2 Tax=Sulfolobus tengchongensis TaxID=207809 RepID=A0AAX4L3Y3_9CREN
MNRSRIEVENMSAYHQIQIPKNPVRRINVFYSLSEGVVVAVDIESRSRKGLLHYTRVILDPRSKRITNYSCDCEGFTFRRKCWHVEYVKETINRKEINERIEEEAKKLLEIEDEIANWG